MRKGQEVTRVPTRGKAAHLGAIAYLAVLAYPNQKEWPKRDAFVECAKAWVSKEYMDRGGDRAKVLLKYRRYKREKIYKHGPLNRAFYRIENWRQPAALMARWVMLQGVEFGGGRIPSKTVPDGIPFKSMRILTAASTITQGAGKLGDLKAIGLPRDRENAIHRIWASTKPVLHLALAFPFHNPRYRSSKKKHMIDTLRLIEDPRWLLPSLRFAECLLLELPQVFPSFDTAKAVRLLPAEYC